VRKATDKTDCIEFSVKRPAGGFRDTMRLFGAARAMRTR